MNPHPPRSAPPAPLRLSLYAWAAGLFLGALEGVLAIGVAAGLGGVGLIGAGLVGLAVGGVLVVAPLVCHELSLRGHKRLMPQAMALGPAGAGVVVPGLAGAAGTRR